MLANALSGSNAVAFKDKSLYKSYEAKWRVINDTVLEEMIGSVFTSIFCSSVLVWDWLISCLVAWFINGLLAWLIDCLIACLLDRSRASRFHNISGYDDEVRTKFGAWTDFFALNIFKWQFPLVTWHDMSCDQPPENSRYLTNCQRVG